MSRSSHEKALDHPTITHIAQDPWHTIECFTTCALSTAVTWVWPRSHECLPFAHSSRRRKPGRISSNGHNSSSLWRIFSPFALRGTTLAKGNIPSSLVVDRSEPLRCRRWRTGTTTIPFGEVLRIVQGTTPHMPKLTVVGCHMQKLSLNMVSKVTPRRMWHGHSGPDGSKASSGCVLHYPSRRLRSWGYYRVDLCLSQMPMLIR